MNKKTSYIRLIQDGDGFKVEDFEPKVIEYSGDIDLGKCHHEALLELSDDILIGAVDCLSKFFTQGDCDGIRELYNELGWNWITKSINHHGWGTGIRNHLRQSGFSDDQLPSLNWDDYYCGIIEITVGIRKLEDYIEQDTNNKNMD